MRSLFLTLCLSVCSGAADAAVPLIGDIPTLHLAGDSTMAEKRPEKRPETGWGEYLAAQFQSGTVLVANHARNGRSTRTFIEEGRWQALLDGVKPGDYVLIQFGHNDQPGKPGRSTDLANEFPANLTRYLVEVKAVGGLPVLVTPLTRRSFRDGALNNDLRPWADAARTVAAAQQVPLLDLNASSAAAVQAMGQSEADTLAEALPGAPRFDRTHLGPKGACLFAGMVAQALPALLPASAGAMRADPECP